MADSWMDNERRDQRDSRREFIGAGAAALAGTAVSGCEKLGAPPPLSEREVKRRLKDGEPRVVYDGTSVRTRLLRDGEERLVAARLREVFQEERA